MGVDLFQETNLFNLKKMELEFLNSKTEVCKQTCIYASFSS